MRHDYALATGEEHAAREFVHRASTIWTTGSYEETGATRRRDKSWSRSIRDIFRPPAAPAFFSGDVARGAGLLRERGTIG
jgi:hypothetical protein